MIGRNNRGIRRASMRVRLAVAAVVLAGGGAAGVVVATSHGGTAAAQSAGFATGYHQQISPTKALSSAMNGWSHNQAQSLWTLSHMTPIRSYSEFKWHHKTLVVQRGTIVLTQRAQFVVKSANGKLELWKVTKGTKIINVGGSSMGMSALTGGTMRARGRMNTATRFLGGGDMVFVFGQRQNHTLKAQLILFVKPMPMVTPTATPSMTTSPSMTPTPSMTATPGMTATPSTVPTSAPPAVPLPGTTGSASLGSHM